VVEALTFTHEKAPPSDIYHSNSVVANVRLSFSLGGKKYTRTQTIRTRIPPND